MKHVALKGFLAVVVTFSATQALAWGSTGHRVVTAEALRGLPSTTPNLLRSSEFIADASEWAREPDRWRLAGTPHDEMRDINHFAYADDDGRLGGGPVFSALPATRDAFAQAVRKAGGDPERVGYLPYAILDAWQQVAKDFVYWRADRAGLKYARDPKALAWLEGDRRRRESQLAFDIGVLSHYVGDATQPMHLSVHHDGWGAGPNPDGFSLEKGHVPYEGPYTAGVVTAEAVRAAMAAPRDLGPAALAVGAYLDTASKEARVWFTLEKSGAFKPGDARGVRYTSPPHTFLMRGLRFLLGKLKDHATSHLAVAGGNTHKAPAPHPPRPGGAPVPRRSHLRTLRASVCSRGARNPWGGVLLAQTTLFARSCCDLGTVNGDFGRI